MPKNKLRPCNYKGCNKLTRHTYCDEHYKIIKVNRQERRINTDKKYNRVRLSHDKEAYKFYHSNEWQSMRKEALIRDRGLCQECRKVKKLTLATEVHHIEPIKQNWGKRYSLDNLICLCKSCHNKIHNR